MIGLIPPAVVRVPEGPTAESLERSEEHTSELQSHHDLVCRLLLEKKKNKTQNNNNEIEAQRQTAKYIDQQKDQEHRSHSQLARTHLTSLSTTMTASRTVAHARATR